MTEAEQVEIAKTDIESLAAKLETLFAGLNDREQAILSHVVRTAAESASDVSGYAADIGTGFAPDLAFAVGLGDISVTKNVDKASPKLMLACVRGSHIKQAQL